MGKSTGISWTDATWNPWRGCHKVSAGCKNCYMFRDAERYGQDPNVVVRSKTTFRDPLKWKEPRKIFTCSWSDWFIEDADSCRDEAWDVIRQTPQHTYQILTKRPENIAARLPADWGDGYPNVWLGVSVEDQQAANRRIPILCDIPALVRFLSCEPLLGFIRLGAKLKPNNDDWDEVNYLDVDDSEPEQFEEECEVERDWINFGHNLVPNPEWVEWDSWRTERAQLFAFTRQVHWVIIGGESGPGFRAMKLEWARYIIHQCSPEIPVWFKQESGIHSGMNPMLDGKEWHQFPQMELDKCRQP